MKTFGSLAEPVTTVVERVRAMLDRLGRAPAGGPRGARRPGLSGSARRDLAELGARLERFRSECPDLMPVEEGPLLREIREDLGNRGGPGYAGFFEGTPPRG